MCNFAGENHTLSIMNTWHKFSLFISLLCLSVSVSAQKQYKDLHNYIKTGQNLDKALALVAACAQDTCPLHDDPKLYAMAAEVEKKRNEAQNTKIYLKQAYDTVTFFSSTIGIFDNLMTQDAKEGIPDEKGRVKHKSRSKIAATLRPYYPNLYSGGLFFIKKKNYKEADRFFSLFIDLPKSPIFEKNNNFDNKDKLPRAAFWSMTSCFAIKDYKGVFKYQDLAMADTANIDLCLQYTSMSYAALGDAQGMVTELMKGIRNVPEDMFFFSRLSDYYNTSKQYDKALQLCDSLIKSDTTKLMYQFSKCSTLFNQKKFDECCSLSTELLKKDAQNADLYYYIASCYYNEASQTEAAVGSDFTGKNFKEKKAQAIAIYQKALPYMETYRKMKPEDTERWADPLYHMYLVLNMGSQFQEIDKVLKQADQKKADEEAKKKAAAEEAKKKK